MIFKQSSKSHISVKSTYGGGKSGKNHQAEIEGQPLVFHHLCEHEEVRCYNIWYSNAVVKAIWPCFYVIHVHDFDVNEGECCLKKKWGGGPSRTTKMHMVIDLFYNDSKWPRNSIYILSQSLLSREKLKLPVLLLNWIYKNWHNFLTLCSPIVWIIIEISLNHKMIIYLGIPSIECHNWIIMINWLCLFSGLAHGWRSWYTMVWQRQSQ